MPYASCHDGRDELYLKVDRMIETFGIALAGGLGSLIVCLYFWKGGQFEDVEDIKYEIFRNDKE